MSIQDIIPSQLFPLIEYHWITLKTVTVHIHSYVLYLDIYCITITLRTQLKVLYCNEMVFLCICRPGINRKSTASS